MKGRQSRGVDYKNWNFIRTFTGLEKVEMKKGPLFPWMWTLKDNTSSTSHFVEVQTLRFRTKDFLTQSPMQFTDGVRKRKTLVQGDKSEPSI